MPVGVVTNNISDKIPLKNLPPDGFVIVRRMNYGEELARSAMATKFVLDGTPTTKEFQGEVSIQIEATALWDFANLVVEHNVEDVDGRVLNFKNPADVKKMDREIGKEIGQIIDDFNAAKESNEVKNS